MAEFPYLYYHCCWLLLPSRWMMAEAIFPLTSSPPRTCNYPHSLQQSLARSPISFLGGGIIGQPILFVWPNHPYALTSSYPLPKRSLPGPSFDPFAGPPPTPVYNFLVGIIVGLPIAFLIASLKPFIKPSLYSLEKLSD